MTRAAQPATSFPIVNNTTRIYNILRIMPAAPGAPADALTIRDVDRRNMVPGLNYLDQDWAEKSNLGKSLELYAGDLVLEDPCTMDQHRAARLAGVTNSRKALRMWAEVEKREPIKKLIAERIAEIN